MGAWIETKPYKSGVNLFAVAPYVGAWIETIHFGKISNMSCKSHPTWVRGLKLFLLTYTRPDSMSHPTWVRGLKLIDYFGAEDNT